MGFKISFLYFVSYTNNYRTKVLNYCSLSHFQKLQQLFHNYRCIFYMRWYKWWQFHLLPVVCLMKQTPITARNFFPTSKWYYSDIQGLFKKYPINKGQMLTCSSYNLIHFKKVSLGLHTVVSMAPPLFVSISGRLLWE